MRSPQNSTRTATSACEGQISTVSPRTLKLPRRRSVELRSYWISTSFLSAASRSSVAPRSSSSNMP